MDFSGATNAFRAFIAKWGLFVSRCMRENAFSSREGARGARAPRGSLSCLNLNVDARGARVRNFLRACFFALEKTRQ